MSGAARRLYALRERPARTMRLVAGCAFLGATAFGLWHLVVGGLIDGNPRAGTFGLFLALAAGVPLIVTAWVAHRRRPRPD